MMLQFRSFLFGVLFTTVIFSIGVALMSLSFLPSWTADDRSLPEDGCDAATTTTTTTTRTRHIAGAGDGMMMRLVPDSCPHASTGTFDKFYETGAWQASYQSLTAFYNNATWPPANRLSASGVGSNLGYPTQISMRILQKTIRDYNVTTMIDIPCGDANWIFDSWETDASLELYIGLDVVKKQVLLNAARLWHHSNKLFRHWDGAMCPLPQIEVHHPDSKGLVERRSVDLVHTRDVLQHLPLDKGVQMLCHILQSGARVLITTTYPPTKKANMFSLRTDRNRNIRDANWFPNILSQDPYNLPDLSGTLSCTSTHPDIEPDLTCVYDLTLPWVAEWVFNKKCHEIATSSSSN